MQGKEENPAGDIGGGWKTFNNDTIKVGLDWGCRIWGGVISYLNTKKRSRKYDDGELEANMMAGEN